MEHRVYEDNKNFIGRRMILLYDNYSGKCSLPKKKVNSKSNNVVIFGEYQNRIGKNSCSFQIRIYNLVISDGVVIMDSNLINELALKSKMFNKKLEYVCSAPKNKSSVKDWNKFLNDR